MRRLNNMKNYAILLAAGEGKRMKVDIPKCAHLLIKKPMAQYVFDAIDKDKINDTILVINPNSKDIFSTIFGDSVKYTFQEQYLGTGDAVRSALSEIKDNDGYTLILPCDVPLLSKDELNDFMSIISEKNFDLGVITTFMDDASNYGRILRQDGDIARIQEAKNASPEELNIKEVNTGIYYVKNSTLKYVFNYMTSGKCHLNTIIEVAKRLGFSVYAYTSNNSDYYSDINDFYTLSQVEGKIKNITNKKHLLNGVNIISPETVTISSEVIIESGVTIYPNTFITGKSIIHTGAVIGPDSEVHNSEIFAGAQIRHSLVTDSKVGENTTVGPFAHLRNHTEVRNNCRIGNFVEIKNSHIDEGTKISHLTYLGDTDCGKNVNWGCGCVTVNYDGKYKHRTAVGDNVFIGCNTNLIAPIKVGNNVFIAAGSTITEDIPDEAFSIARTRQVTKEDYARKYSYKK